MIEVRFFGKLGDIAGESLQLDNSAATTVADILKYLSQEVPALHDEVTGPQVLIAVNQQIVTSGHPVSEGDEVAFLPPVTGG